MDGNDPRLGDLSQETIAHLSNIGGKLRRSDPEFHVNFNSVIKKLIENWNREPELTWHESYLEINRRYNVLITAIDRMNAHIEDDIDG